MKQLSRQSTLRAPIVLLAVLDLAILATRLWPWQNVMSLPGNGTTGFDPAISLAAYIGLAFWIGSARDDASRRMLASAALLGALAGLCLVAQVVIGAREAAVDPAAGLDRVQIGLMLCALLIIALAAFRTARAAFTLGFAAVCAIWASMLACLMAVAATLGQTYLAAGTGESSDAWKEYQGLAIGNPATQALVHSLDTIAGFLLIGPILGCIAGSLLAMFAKPRKP